MKEEIYRLISLAQSGEKSALETLVSENSGLIWCVVKKFSGRGVEKDDLFQIGAMGLIKAVKNFKLEFNVEFSTYAIPMIMGEIKRFLRDDGLIKVSRTHKETAIMVKAISEKFHSENGRVATVNEIAELLNKTPEEVLLAIEATQPAESIYKSVFSGDSSPVLLIDKLYSDNGNEEKLLTSIALREAIENLEFREKQIIKLRYYKEKSQSEVARILGVSQVQISRIERKLLGILRKNIS